jgi:hypothetical protein
MTTSISIFVPTPTPKSSPTVSRLSSPASITVSVTIASSPSQSTWQPPLLEEFLTDIERRRLEPVLDTPSNPNTLYNFLVEIGQEKDPTELIEARQIALATSGLFAAYTPTIAWNYHLGDKEAFYAKRFAQVNTKNSLLES